MQDLCCIMEYKVYNSLFYVVELHFMLQRITQWIILNCFLNGRLLIEAQIHILRNLIFQLIKYSRVSINAVDTFFLITTSTKKNAQMKS